MESKKTSRDWEIFKMVFAAILIAMIIIFTIVGYITYGIVTLTLVHIPVLIGAVILGKRYGLLLGFVFGLGSLIRSFVMVQDIPFTNPLVSVVPRMFFGYMTGFLAELFKNKIKNKTILVALLMIVSTIIHTLVVIVVLFPVARTGFHFYSGEFDFSNILVFLKIIVIGNMVWEVLAAVLIGTPIVLSLQKVISTHYYMPDKY